ncbi:hypothetical protein EIN_467490 [Entamoeba invadens IP1]|uniref:SPRY domain-containing protein n=1 Tax=Entamoeba invadens IP1 TaxID=370355 RepID=A0A0A1TUG4_ENTIV|nr:hypothetical protein EIN_467490 [Entamoeba invadens IP1]ELP83665.1 hypothetical protein EIN_467490 [Entamoeba invadens IP1]|eukprot:XP_004183011.1 hypothetical protein EIN_467490 [Entamoeba invadens IP1]
MVSLDHLSEIYTFWRVTIISTFHISRRLVLMIFVSCMNVTFAEKCKIPQLRKLDICDSEDVNFNCKINNLETLFIHQVYNIKFTKNFVNLKRLTVINSNCVQFPQFTFEDKVVHISRTHGVTFGGIYLSALCNNYFGFDYVDFDTFEYPITAHVDDIWVMSKFVSMSRRIDVCGASIQRDINVAEDEYDMAVSFDFFNKKNVEKKMKFIDKNNEEKTIENVRYFEVEVTGYSLVSIGLIGTNNMIYNDVQVGWCKYTIGYHSDDGMIYHGYPNNTCFNTKTYYGKSVDVVYVVGVGIKKLVNENKFVFFLTLNGKIVFKTGFRSCDVEAAIGMGEFNKIVVNYGNSKFQFDLNSLSKNELLQIQENQGSNQKFIKNEFNDLIEWLKLNKVEQKNNIL